MVQTNTPEWRSSALQFFTGSMLPSWFRRGGVDEDNVTRFTRGWDADMLAAAAAAAYKRVVAAETRTAGHTVDCRCTSCPRARRARTLHELLASMMPAPEPMETESPAVLVGQKRKRDDMDVDAELPALQVDPTAGEVAASVLDGVLDRVIAAAGDGFAARWYPARSAIPSSLFTMETGAARHASHGQMLYVMRDAPQNGHPRWKLNEDTQRWLPNGTYAGSKQFAVMARSALVKQAFIPHGKLLAADRHMNAQYATRRHQQPVYRGVSGNTYLAWASEQPTALVLDLEWDGASEVGKLVKAYGKALAAGEQLAAELEAGYLDAKRRFDAALLEVCQLIAAAIRRVFDTEWVWSTHMCSGYKHSAHVHTVLLPGETTLLRGKSQWARFLTVEVLPHVSDDAKLIIDMVPLKSNTGAMRWLNCSKQQLPGDTSAPRVLSTEPVWALSSQRAMVIAKAAGHRAYVDMLLPWPRADDAASEAHIFDLCAEAYPPIVGQSSSRSVRPPTTATVDGGEQQAPCAREQAVLASATYKALCAWVHSLDRFAKPHIIDCRINESGATLTLVTTSTHCLARHKAGAARNPGPHRSNHVYYTLTRAGVRQRCHSSCTNARGVAWASNTVPLPAALAAAIAAELPSFAAAQPRVAKPGAMVRSEVYMPALPNLSVGGQLVTDTITHEDVATRYIQPYAETLTRTGASTLLVHAGKGMGKSKAMFDYCRQLVAQQPDARIAVVTHRITLASAQAAELKAIGFELYNNSRGELGARAIVQLDSLWRLGSKRLDALFLDESESLFSHMQSTLMGRKSDRVWQTLCTAVSSARHVFALDAFMTARTKNLITLMRNQTNTVLCQRYTHHPNQHRSYIMHSDLSEMRGHLVEAATTRERRRQRIVVCSLSKAIALELQESISKLDASLKVLTYVGSTRSDIKARDFADVTTAWDGVDVLIYTPTLSCGVSFEVRGHFDTAYLIGMPSVATAGLLHQMAGRVRDLKSNTLHFCIRGSHLLNAGATIRLANQCDFAGRRDALQQIACPRPDVTQHVNDGDAEAGHEQQRPTRTQRLRDVLTIYNAMERAVNQHAMLDSFLVHLTEMGVTNITAYQPPPPAPAKAEAEAESRRAAAECAMMGGEDLRAQQQQRMVRRNRRTDVTAKELHTAPHITATVRYAAARLALKRGQTPINPFNRLRLAFGAWAHQRAMLRMRVCEAIQRDQQQCMRVPATQNLVLRRCTLEDVLKLKSRQVQLAHCEAWVNTYARAGFTRRFHAARAMEAAAVSARAGGSDADVFETRAAMYRAREAQRAHLGLHVVCRSRVWEHLGTVLRPLVGANPLATAPSITITAADIDTTLQQPDVVQAMAALQPFLTATTTKKANSGAQPQDLAKQLPQLLERAGFHVERAYAGRRVSANAVLTVLSLAAHCGAAQQAAAAPKKRHRSAHKRDAVAESKRLERELRRKMRAELGKRTYGGWLKVRKAELAAGEATLGVE